MWPFSRQNTLQFKFLDFSSLLQQQTDEAKSLKFSSCSWRIYSSIHSTLYIFSKQRLRFTYMTMELYKWFYLLTNPWLVIIYEMILTDWYWLPANEWHVRSCCGFYNYLSTTWMPIWSKCCFAGTARLRHSLPFHWLFDKLANYSTDFSLMYL